MNIQVHIYDYYNEDMVDIRNFKNIEVFYYSITGRFTLEYIKYITSYRIIAIINPTPEDILYFDILGCKLNAASDQQRAIAIALQKRINLPILPGLEYLPSNSEIFFNYIDFAALARIKFIA